MMRSEKMHVPFLDLQPQHQLLRGELQQSWADILDQTAFIAGERVQRFEDDFAAYCEVKHAIGVANGTDALTLAIAALGINPGDEVITAANSFIATAEAIVHAGAKPVFADVDPDTLNIDVAEIKASITPRTRAVIPVHLYGQPADMDPVLHIAEEHGLYVIEDASQAHGARYKGRRVGSLGHAACFSFYPSKNLGACGDGGAVVTNDDMLALMIRKLHDHGGITKYQHDLIGYNSRLDTLQAAVLSVKLPYLDDWNARRQAHAKQYAELLAETPGLRLPQVLPETSSVYHLYVIRVEYGGRDDLQCYLVKRGIQTGIHYPDPIPLTPAFAHVDQTTFVHAASAARTLLSLPLFPELKPEQVQYVAACVNEYLVGYDKQETPLGESECYI